MLSLDQCIDLCGLNAEEVELLAEHENVPEIVAAQLACQWLQTPQGVERIQCALLDRLERARCGGDHRRVGKIEETVVQFVKRHPAISTRWQR